VGDFCTNFVGVVASWCSTKLSGLVKVLDPPLARKSGFSLPC
jgi:hypothetical protein